MALSRDLQYQSIVRTYFTAASLPPVICGIGTLPSLQRAFSNPLPILYFQLRQSRQTGHVGYGVGAGVAYGNSFPDHN